ncbi:MAG: F0F1 ATP synthase subunit epsilon [Acidimicrobiia bacterium]|nr:F0F1 ATP synthase subunit epsilon [Acidimicrobiia bacterium]MDX2466900.1 F0F1 ATP synthase subunit epsilon [Acidimicrobiia bacterium]
MADKLFTVDVVAPEAIVWSGEATFIAARTTEGEIGILADHEATMAALATGPVEIHTADDEVVTIGIHGGFLQIFDNSVTLLTDRAETSPGGRVEALRLAEELKAAQQRAVEENAG